jgi:hypothetical protein
MELVTFHDAAERHPRFLPTMIREEEIVVPFTEAAQGTADTILRWFSDLFDEPLPWKLHHLCMNAGTEPGERTMCLFRVAENVTCEQAVQLAKQEGYRPATHGELQAFLDWYEGRSRSFRVATLGMFYFLKRYELTGVVGFEADGNKRLLTGVWHDTDWSADMHLLFVRMEP